MIPQSTKGINQNSSQLLEVRFYTFFLVYLNFVLFFFFHTSSPSVERGWKNEGREVKKGEPAHNAEWGKGTL